MALLFRMLIIMLIMLIVQIRSVGLPVANV